MHPGEKTEEIYRGYRITSYWNGYSTFYNIRFQGERATKMCISSVKAAKNIIDTYLKNNH